ncbi:LppX_LprAFG lipoprotein [Nocardioides mesophilus]|uniref:LppX_LprAFG lipoprotein n=1 Tax=Nocardioides mesophilus TaxID=433659 RepID=A0A7G9RBM9_9ACTN|nr:LppX_LprAFG lipoprotein [Nocardioides mesophilus]QNN53004.1 LppX_LprAFG lipoprotein [Nocardioides mesophilus]
MTLLPRTGTAAALRARPHSRSRVALALLGVLLAAPLAACSGSQAQAQSPEETLASAKAALDETSGVRLSLQVDNLPRGVNGLVSAEGVATHDPAFDGTIKVAAAVTADAAVIAVDGKVYAMLPFTQKYVEIDPSDYSAPDPADLMSTEDGLSSLLTSAEDVEQGNEVRDGEDVLTTYTGTLAGDLVAAIIPTASPDGQFDVTFTLDDSDRVTEILMTGPFYPAAADVSYTVDLEDYGVKKEITAP